MVRGIVALKPNLAEGKKERLINAQGGELHECVLAGNNNRQQLQSRAYIYLYPGGSASPIVVEQNRALITTAVRVSS